MSWGDAGTIIGLLFGLYGCIMAWKSERRAKRAESNASRMSKLQQQGLSQTVLDGLKTRLRPLYSTPGIFKQEFLKMLEEGYETKMVLQAMEQACNESDERVDRRTRRIIDYRAEILDRSDELKTTNQS